METPPPILDSAKVIAYATFDKSVVRARDDLLYVDGQPLGPMPKLAICVHPHESEYYLFHCDADWDVLESSAHDSIETAKRRAEDEYLGLMGSWQPFHHKDEAEIDRQCLEPSCSFCGKSYLRVEKMVEGKNAWICEACVRTSASLLDGQS